ncbi:hypothetical protein TNCV_4123131 [Trichonephila clavipes]|nr:hypothetical protein TNCV_4123131 [Trichonephila clavipes]
MYRNRKNFPNIPCIVDWDEVRKEFKGNYTIGYPRVASAPAKSSNALHDLPLKFKGVITDEVPGVSTDTVTFLPPSVSRSLCGNIHETCILHLSFENYCVVHLAPPKQPLEPNKHFPRRPAVCNGILKGAGL